MALGGGKGQAGADLGAGYRGNVLGWGMSKSTELWGVTKPCLQCERPGGLGPGSSMTVAQNMLVDLDSAFLFLYCGGSGPEKVKRNRSLSRFAEL